MSTPTSPAISSRDRDAFYAAGVAGLRALDARETKPRRFGADADLRWNAIKGALTDADRIDLLLRDGAVTWGAAFSPAEVFGLFGLAPDEPFGPDWQPLSGTSARRYLAEADVAAGPAELGKLLGISQSRVELPDVSPSTHLAVAGGAALIAVAQVFVAQPSLSWSDQILAIAVTPAHRQLAALLAIVTRSLRRTPIARPTEDLRAVLKSASLAQIDEAVVSADAEPDCADFARRAAGVV